MYQQLKTRLATLLSRPRPLKPQTKRQLAHHLSEHSTSLPAFLLCASAVLEDYELDILFGPVFTPSLEERAELADLLFHWKPTAEQLMKMIGELSTEIPNAVVILPDGSEAKLTLHEVMVDRMVRLLRLEHGPDPATAAALRESLPAELWPIAIALLCERGMTPDRQAWFAAFIQHLTGDTEISRGLLQTIVEFIGSQPTLKNADLVKSAEALLRATQGTAAYAASGHTYWSPDVAQHHQYRGEGRVDQGVLEHRQAEVLWVTAMVSGLRGFDGHPAGENS